MVVASAHNQCLVKDIRLKIGEAIMTHKTCAPLPAVPHAERTPSSGPLPVGHTLNYISCSMGYFPFGYPYTSCQDDGKWSDITFKCIKDQCFHNGNYRADRWCYYFGNITMNSTAAQDFCSARNMHLVRIETQLEWQTLQPLLVDSYWTAGYATVLNETNNITAFYWGPGNDTDVITFFSWAPGQPDDPSIESDITVNSTGWYDEREDVEIYALCEDDGGIS
ncbi:uncharacterized protein LOC125673773 [Ostrea edulis]|uniref:uncharacterized protein LOC125673773 n=1 Tax=Ostrea edulis TaxID=37623 RepID=UPI0024AFDD2D|nr:uncharacterized protein LOC125673773 [Ostrea edulis]